MRLREAWAHSRQRLERADIPDADIEAQVLLRNTLGIDRVTFYASPDRELSDKDAEAFDAHGWAADRWESLFLTSRDTGSSTDSISLLRRMCWYRDRRRSSLVEAVLGYARSRGRGRERA